MYESLRGELLGEEEEEGAVFHDPAISLVGEGCLRLDGSRCLGGSVAMALDKIVSKRDLLSCRTLLPHPLFEQGQEYFPAEGSPHSAELTTPLLSSILEETRSEMEEGEGEEGVSNIPPQATGTGLNVFIQSHGTGSLSHGPLDLRPALNIGRLLESADSGVAGSCDRPFHPLLEAARNCPTSRSLSSYLELCRCHLGFSERETEHAQKLYERIEGAGEGGVEEAWLEESYRDNSPSCERSHQDYIQAFINFEMVSI